jgi:hypothetical protein
MGPLAGVALGEAWLEFYYYFFILYSTMRRIRDKDQEMPQLLRTLPIYAMLIEKLN